MLGGGRIIGMLEYYLRIGAFPNWTMFFAPVSSGKFRWCGSLFMALCFLPYLSRKLLKINSFNALFDMLVLCFCVFRMITVWACQFSGDGCYGIHTNLPWGCNYAYGIAPTLLKVHPTPVYDSIFILLFFGYLLNWDLKHKKVAGQTAYKYFLVVPIFYTFLEMIRINPVIAYGITLPQLVYGVIILLSVAIFKKLLKQEKRKVIFQESNINHSNNNKYSKKFLQRHRL